MSKYVAESITMIAGRFGHEGLCQLRTELKKLQCEIGYIANTGQWCCVMLSGCINNLIIIFAHDQFARQATVFDIYFT